MDPICVANPGELNALEISREKVVIPTRNRIVATLKLINSLIV